MYPAQVNQLLEVGDRAAGMNKYTAMDKWANQLKSIHTSVCNKT
jgi:COP9 signalosome complex subunit 2